jgi:hypothetical protein
MHGVFFNEIPNDFTSEKAAYLTTMNKAAKVFIGLLQDKVV